MGPGQPGSHPPRPLHPGGQEPPASPEVESATRACHLHSRRGSGRAVPTRERDTRGSPGLRAAAREPARGRQGAGGSSSPGASPPRSPPPTRRPLTDFHSAVVEARGGGVQGVEAAVQRGGAAAQRGRLALELSEDVPGAARQVGELRQQADQGVRADLLQRAEERRVRGSGRLGPAQPGGLHGPLVEGHGAAAAGASTALKPPPVGAGRESASNTKKSPGGRGAPRGSLATAAGCERTDRRTRGLAGGRRGTGARGGAGRAPAGPSRGCLAPGGAPPPAGVPGPRGRRKFREQLPGGGRGGGEWRRESR